MASIQQLPAEFIAALNDQQKADAQKMVKEVQSVDGGAILQDRAYGELHYYGIQRPEVAKYYESHNWSGAVVKNYPPILPKDAIAQVFVHQGANNVSKAGVAYYNDDRYWLVAWNVPNNQIYVKAGPKATAIDWNTIEKELNGSGASSFFQDPEVGYTEAIGHVLGNKLSIYFYG